MTNKEIISIMTGAKLIIEDEWPEEHSTYKIVPRLEAAIKEMEKRITKDAHNL